MNDLNNADENYWALAGAWRRAIEHIEYLEEQLDALTWLFAEHLAQA